MTNSMTRYETVFESTKNLPRFIEIGHGENADLYTSITDCGEPVSLSGYTVSALYQPSSKWGTTEYYSCPLEVVGDTVIIHWSHLQDNGDNGVKMWVSFSKDDELAYPALYKIGLFQTPGFEPSPITPIPEVLDFSLYTLLNAPWVLPEQLSAYVTKEQADEGWFTEWECDPAEYDGHAIEITPSGDYAFYPSVDGERAGGNKDADPDVVTVLTWANGDWIGDGTLTATRHRVCSPIPTTPEDIGAQPAGDYATVDSLSAYATKASLSAYATTDSLSDYATTESLSDYATTESLSDYATTASLSAYATKTSLSAYATQSEVDEFHEDFRQAITEISNTKYMKTVKSGEGNNIYLYYGYSVYRATLSSDTTGYRLARPQSAGIPTDDFYYDYEIEVSVPANATSLSGPTSDWTWMEGGELPTDPSDFAGKTIYIACRFDCDARTTLANVWRIA